MMNLKNNHKKISKLLGLDKPLIIFDIEATGLTISTDKIVGLAYVKIWPEGRVNQDEIVLNPEMNISKESTQFHGLTNEDVKDRPPFRKKAQEIYDVFNDCYYGGHNVVNFDLPMLRREFIRVGMDFNYKIARVIDARVIFQAMVPRTLTATYEYYTKNKFSYKHSAVSDVEAVIEIYIKQLEKYKEIRNKNFLTSIHEKFVEELNSENTRKFYWRNGEAYFAFSKYSGQTLKEITKKDPEFLKWMLTADFSEETKNIIRMAIEERARKDKKKDKKK